MALPAGLDVDALQFLERHEALVHALPGRELRELGDALMLYDPIDREPFWNRVNAINWPDEPGAFDRRLAETISLFHILDRIPHIWPRPALNQPRDLTARLLANGWEDVGGGHIMLLVDPEPARLAETPTDHLVTIERLHQLEGEDARESAADLAMVLSESFEVEPGRQTAIELETLAMFDRPEMHGYLARVDGEPAAAAKRATFDGGSYLSSIGTRPGFRGRGLGRLVTAAATADAIAAGSRWIYLGVYTDNVPAVRLYEGLGFARVGDAAPDLLLR